MLAAVRAAIGPAPQDPHRRQPGLDRARGRPAARRWHEQFDLDFVEAPVPIDPVELMLDLKRRVPVPLCVNEGLWREADACRIIDSRCGDYFASAPTGSARCGASSRSCHAAQAKGWQVCKHTHGELGLAAAAGQHLMLALPNACDGHQQTAQLMADDILAEPLPIATARSWGRIEAPGLGVEVDEAKLARYHQDFLDHGEFPPYGGKFGKAEPFARPCQIKPRRATTPERAWARATVEVAATSSRRAPGHQRLLLVVRLGMSVDRLWPGCWRSPMT